MSSKRKAWLQGLSGLNFAFKIIVLGEWWQHGKAGSYPYVAFELAESLILLEDKTLLYHLSGILVGLVSGSFSLTSFVEARFPGRGHRLGGRGGGGGARGVGRPSSWPAAAQPSEAPITRSWGYAGQENRFLDSRTLRNRYPPPVSRSGTSGPLTSMSGSASIEEGKFTPRKKTIFTKNL